MASTANSEISTSIYPYGGVGPGTPMSEFVNNAGNPASCSLLGQGGWDSLGYAYIGSYCRGRAGQGETNSATYPGNSRGADSDTRVFLCVCSRGS